MEKAESEKEPTLRELFPELSDEELVEVRDVLEDYVQSTIRLYERLESDPEAYAAFQRALARRKKHKKRH